MARLKTAAGEYLRTAAGEYILDSPDTSGCAMTFSGAAAEFVFAESIGCAMTFAGSAAEFEFEGSQG